MPSFRLTARQDEGNHFLAGPRRHKLLYGGARSGKTFLLCRAIVMRGARVPTSRHAILRFRANAVRSSIALDTLPKVVRECFPGLKLTEHRQDGFFELPNKSQIWLGGLDEKDRVEKILGQEYATILFNECSQIPYSSVLVARTRLAQVVGSLPQRAYYDLNPAGAGHWSNIEFGERRDPTSRAPLANGDDFVRLGLNPEDNRQNLSPEFLASLDALPERQRKRFYEGVYVSEIEGALWTLEQLERVRVEPDEVPQLERIVVAVDPSGARGLEDKRSDEIGIIVAGKAVDGRAYVLEDLTCRLGPSGWAKRAVDAFHKWGADAIVAEMNYGKAMVEDTIRAQDPRVPIIEVHASRGKHVRAEPISVLYDEKRDLVRHVGRFPDLEDQMCMFSTGGYTGERSPDRADSLIWALTELMVEAEIPTAYFGTFQRTR
jgi:hypothetical protein